MPASEIDDIFSGVASSSKATAEPVTASKKKKKSSGKKRKSDVAESVGESETQAGSRSSAKNLSGKANVVEQDSKKKKVAETVLDPSKVIESKVAKKSKVPAKKLNDEDEDFRDTRGKKRARTEDGFPIYSAEELQIDDNSGGTPLCPFDCDCCH